jgi:hypothetical protein
MPAIGLQFSALDLQRETERCHFFSFWVIVGRSDISLLCIEKTENLGVSRDSYVQTKTRVAVT